MLFAALISIACPLMAATATPPESRSLDGAQRQSAPSFDSTTQVPSSRPQSAAEELDEFVRLITGANTPEARELGARSLLRHGSEDAARRLVQILETANDSLAKIAVCRAIISFESPNSLLLDPLISLLGQNAPEVGPLVGAALRRFDRDEVIPRLRAVGADNKQALERRSAAIGALGTLGDDLEAAKALIELLQQQPDATRGAIFDALSEVAGIRIGDAAAATLWWDDHRDMEPIDWLRQVNQRRKDDSQRLRADREALLARLVVAYREAYLLMPEAEQSKKLLAFLSDDAAAVRALALDLIDGLITDRKEISSDTRRQLLKLVADTNPIIRRRAAGIVGDLRPAGAGEVLRSALAVELEPAARVAQVNALGRLDDVHSIPVLIARLDDPARAVMIEAIASLGQVARRGVAGADAVESVVAAISGRFDSLAPDDDECRTRCIEAMGRIGAEAFRPLLIVETTGARSTGPRSAAILALSGYSNSAKSLRGLVAAQEPDIRLAAVHALGRCGSKKQDLEALSICLDADQEPNATVRERAWESYLIIARQLAFKHQMEITQQFDRPNDLAAQRRRADFLLAIINGNGTDRPNALTPVQKLSIYEALADAQSALLDHDAEVRALDEALRLAAEADVDGVFDLQSRRIVALVRAYRAAAAVARFAEYAASLSGDSDKTRVRKLAETLAGAIKSRAAEAVTGDEFTRLLEFIDIAIPAVAGVSADAAAELKNARADAEEARLAALNRLLDSPGTESEVIELRSFGPELVLPAISERLSKSGPERPSPDREARLIEAAKMLAPGWTGYAAGATEGDRRGAIEALARLAPPAGEPDSGVSDQ